MTAMSARKPAAEPQNTPAKPKIAKGGRPSIFSPELLQTICDRLSEGEPLAVICREPGMPDASTVWKWRDERKDVFQALALARARGFDTIARNTRKVARGEEGHSSGDVARDKLIVDTDLKLLAVWDPKRYGAKQFVEQEIAVTQRSAIDPTTLTAEERDMLKDVLVRALEKHRNPQAYEALPGPNDEDEA